MKHFEEALLSCFKKILFVCIVILLCSCNNKVELKPSNLEIYDSLGYNIELDFRNYMPNKLVNKIENNILGYGITSKQKWSSGIVPIPWNPTKFDTELNKRLNTNIANSIYYLVEGKYNGIYKKRIIRNTRPSERTNFNSDIAYMSEIAYMKININPDNILKEKHSKEFEDIIGGGTINIYLSEKTIERYNNPRDLLNNNSENINIENRNNDNIDNLFYIPLLYQDDFNNYQITVGDSICFLACANKFDKDYMLPLVRFDKEFDYIKNFFQIFNNKQELIEYYKNNVANLFSLLFSQYGGYQYNENF